MYAPTAYGAAGGYGVGNASGGMYMAGQPQSFYSNYSARSSLVPPPTQQSMHSGYSGYSGYPRHNGGQQYQPPHVMEAGASFRSQFPASVGGGAQGYYPQGGVPPAHGVGLDSATGSYAPNNGGHPAAGSYSGNPGSNGMSKGLSKQLQTHRRNLAKKRAAKRKPERDRFGVKPRVEIDKEVMNERLVTDERSQLLFSKKPRRRQYEPYTLSDFKRMQPTKYVELGKLQPNLNTKEHREKLAKKEKARAYAERQRALNAAKMMRQNKRQQAKRQRDWGDERPKQSSHGGARKSAKQRGAVAFGRRAQAQAPQSQKQAQAQAPRSQQLSQLESSERRGVGEQNGGRQPRKPRQRQGRALRERRGSADDARRNGQPGTARTQSPRQYSSGGSDPGSARRQVLHGRRAAPAGRVHVTQGAHSLVADSRVHGGGGGDMGPPTGRSGGGGGDSYGDDDDGDDDDDDDDDGYASYYYGDDDGSAGEYHDDGGGGEYVGAVHVMDDIPEVDEFAETDVTSERHSSPRRAAPTQQQETSPRAVRPHGGLGNFEAIDSLEAFENSVDVGGHNGRPAPVAQSRHALARRGVHGAAGRRTLSDELLDEDFVSDSEDDEFEADSDEVTEGDIAQLAAGTAVGTFSDVQHVEATPKATPGEHIAPEDEIDAIRREFGI